jgi:uncharacterized protein (TIGR02453 family)
VHLRELTRFLLELSENNNRAWFVMNKPRYDILRAEFLELVTALIGDIAKFDPAIAACNPKRALFRINRDLRFARNRDPYKTTFSASLTASGLKKPSQGGGPAYYFQVNADGKLLTACGEYLPPADRLRAIREHIVNDAAGFARVLRDKGLNDCFGGLSPEDSLVRPPKGFDAESPHIEQIKLKSFLVWREVNANRLASDKLRAHLLNDFWAGQPLVKWLRDAGPTL